MNNPMFRTALALLVTLATAGLTACGNKDASEVKPDPSLPANQPGASAPASPPPGQLPNKGSDAPKAAQLGTLQDLCGMSLVKDGFGGVVKSFVRFSKDGKVVVVDPCVSDGATQVSFEKFTVRGREDLLIASNVCPPESTTCWYRILDLSKVPSASTLKYATLDQLKLAGRYKDGETTMAIPGDAMFTIGALVDDKGAPKPVTVRYITQYRAAPSAPDNSSYVLKSDFDKWAKGTDARLAQVETNTTKLMSAYSDWLRAKEAM